MMKVEIFDKARELGMMLSETEEYRHLQTARAAYESDPAIREQLDALDKMSEQMDEMTESGEYDKNTLATLRQQLRRAQKALESHPAAMEMDKARQDFAAMMQEVNQVMHFVITGELPPAMEHEGCAGGCGGCGRVH